jgi:uncharacterized phage-associated protein
MAWPVKEVLFMAKVQDVARFFIDLAQHQNERNSGDLMTNLRLQKLLYFAQGWYLARFGKALFDEPIEAWCTARLCQRFMIDIRVMGDRESPKTLPFRPMLLHLMSTTFCWTLRGNMMTVQQVRSFLFRMLRMLPGAGQSNLPLFRKMKFKRILRGKDRYPLLTTC